MTYYCLYMQKKGREDRSTFIPAPDYMLPHCRSYMIRSERICFAKTIRKSVYDEQVSS